MKIVSKGSSVDTKIFDDGGVDITKEYSDAVVVLRSGEFNKLHLTKRRNVSLEVDVQPERTEISTDPKSAIDSVIIAIIDERLSFWTNRIIEEIRKTETGPAYMQNVEKALKKYKKCLLRVMGELSLRSDEEKIEKWFSIVEPMYAFSWMPDKILSKEHITLQAKIYAEEKRLTQILADRKKAESDLS